MQGIGVKMKAIIFDFDGVIAESVDVKTSAFRELFKDHPEIVGDVEKFHLENGGMSRYDKFRYIYKNMLKEPLSDERFDELCRKFHAMVVDKVVEVPYVKGAIELLDMCKGRYPMYIVSGTPVEEMIEVVQRRRINDYFVEVYGSPVSKTELINRIIKNGGYDRDKVLFIGDSHNDLIAAEETGVIFFARGKYPEQGWMMSKKVKKVFKDLAEIKAFLQEKLLG